MDPLTTTTTLLGDPTSKVTFSRTIIDHGVPMAMAVLAILLAIVAGYLLGYLLGRRPSGRRAALLALQRAAEAGWDPGRPREAQQRSRASSNGAATREPVQR